MSSAKRLARIQLCGTHEFSNAQIENSKSPNFVQCLKGCGLEFGEWKDGQSVFNFKLDVRMVD